MLPRTFTRGLPPCHILVAPKPPPQGPALCSPAPPLILGRPACKAGTVTLRSRLPGAHTFSLPEKTISKAIWGFSSFQEPMVSAHSQENWNDFCAFVKLKSSGLAFRVCFGDRPPTAAVDPLSPLLPLLSTSGFPLGLAEGAPQEIRGARLPSRQPTSLEGHSSFRVAISRTCSSPGFQKPLPPF